MSRGVIAPDLPAPIPVNDGENTSSFSGGSEDQLSDVQNDALGGFLRIGHLEIEVTSFDFTLITLLRGQSPHGYDGR